MNTEQLISKWLDHNLSPEEQKAFEALPDYPQLMKLDNALNRFKAPDFEVIEGHKAVQHQVLKSKPKKKNWLRLAAGIAATIVIAIGINYVVNSSSDINITTKIAEQNLTTLPDQSEVQLNSKSILTFNDKSWNNDRLVNLSGEAFFKVAKGKTFTVNTELGTIQVLGTQFNVKQRDGFFEVTCFEGIVLVNSKNDSMKLLKNQTVRLVDGKLIAIEKDITYQPYWIGGESYFKNVALKDVIMDLQSQYDVKIETKSIDVSRQFTGSFTHKDLNLALKSITIPLHLKYRITGKSIILERE